MKNVRIAEQKGIAQIFLLVGMLLIALALPVATRLVQQNQENRSKAANCGELSDAACERTSGCFLWTTGLCKNKVANGKDCESDKWCTSGYCNFNDGKCGVANAGKCKDSNGKLWNNNAAVCINNIEYICKAPSSTAQGSLVKTNDCVKCGSNGKCDGIKASCSASNCGSCGTASTCGAISGCVWSYSGNYCEKKTSCTSGGKTIANGDHTCQTTGSNSVEYICNSGALKVVEECGTGCSSNGQTCAVSKSKKGSCNTTYHAKSFTYDKFPVNSNVVCSTGSTRWVDGAANDNTWNWRCLDLNDAGTATSTGVDCYANKTASATKTQCETNGGQCMTGASGMTSGVTCSLNGVANSGKTILSGGCANGYVCCLPASAKQDGVCVTYASTSAYARIDSTCVSGEVSWVGGDSAGKDGQFEWKCNGINGGASSATCTAKSKVDAICGTTKLTCSAGNVDDNAVADTDTAYNWACKGLGGGATVSNCTAKKSTGGNPPSNPTTVTPPTTVPSTAITLNPTTVTLAVGGTKQVTFTLTPTTSTDTVAWSSSNTAIATVSNSGLITGVAVGTATITATTTSGKTGTVVVTVSGTVSGTLNLSFKVAFAGIKPSAACIGSLGNLNVEVLNVPTNTSQSGLTPSISKGNDDEIDALGNQIFYVNNVVLESKFSTLNTFNVVKVKGPFHLRRRMCQEGQNSKLPETTTCNISLTSPTTTYNFANYTLLAGDTDQNGIINSIDFSYVKTRFNAAADVSCGREGDLNMDGVVNALDINLVKDALSSRDDE